MKQIHGWGAVGAVLLAVALFSINRGQGRVCTKRDMCREDEDGIVRCNWRHCPGCAVVVHSDKELEFDFRCRRGVPEGRGIFTLDSGDIYSGNFRQGTMHGHGRYLWRNGDEYEGQWVHDTMEGHGVLETNDGARYEGSFSAGRMHGHGTLRSGKGKWQRHRKPTRAHSCGTTISLRGGEPKSRAWLRDNSTLHDKEEN